MSFFSRLQTLDLQNVLKAGRGHYAGHLNIWHQKLFSARYVTYFFVCILKIYQRNQETLLCILVSDPRIFVAFFKDKKNIWKSSKREFLLWIFYQFYRFFNSFWEYPINDPTTRSILNTYTYECSNSLLYVTCLDM